MSSFFTQSPDRYDEGQYRGLLADFDGTVHHSERRVSSTVLSALQQLKAREIRFGFCTGRQFDFIAPYATQLGEAHIVCGGSCLVDREGQVIRQTLMHPDAIQSVLDFVDEHRGSLVLKTPYTGYANAAALEIARHRKGLHLQPLAQVDYRQVVAFYAAGLEEALWDAMATLPGISICKQYYSRNGQSGIFVDGTAEGISKVSGVSWWCDYHQIALEKVIAIGDGENDIPMFEAVGLGLAMGNAVASLKAIADATVPSLDEDGVAWVVQHYFHA